MEALEVRGAPRVLDDHFTIEDCQLSLAAEVVSGIPVRPVVTVARKGTHGTAVKHEYGAIAVMLDLVNPSVSRGRLFRKGGELRLDKAEARNI